MDLIRSCYSADMALFRDDPTRLTRVRWYFVPYNRPIMGFPSPFRSRVWDIPEEPPGTLGERYSPRPWSGGLPGQTVSKGGHCGTPEEWAEGVYASEPIPEYWPGTEIPKCCAHPPEKSIGTIAIGAFGPISGCCGDPPDLNVAHVTFHALAGSRCDELEGTTFGMHKQVSCTTENVWISDLIPWSGFFTGQGYVAIRCNGTNFYITWFQDGALLPCGGIGVTAAFSAVYSCRPFWGYAVLNMVCDGGIHGGQIRLDFTS